MSKKANPTTIGGFVIAAVFLLASATIVFGGGEFFEKHERLVAYFPESVKGLRNGANVLFRGVRIGFVEEIKLQGDADTAVTLVQVIMRINPARLEITRKGIPVQMAPDKDDVEPIDLIAAGLRAQLGVESFVTGQLVVEFEFFPGSEIVLRGVKAPYVEMPTVANNIQQLVARVQSFVADLTENLDLKQIGQDIQNAANGISELANSQELRSAISGADQLLNDENTQQLTARLGSALSEARSTLTSIQSLIADADKRMGPLVDELGTAIGKLDGTLSAAESTLRSAGDQLRGDTEMSYQLIGTLQEVEAASRSLRVFLDYLERNPEALLRGKREQ
jgi:paraquat-inducible protein B